jgi:uncharacterized protein YjeT (DUF2065 family)
MNNIYFDWLVSSLFILGILVILLGLSIVLLPEKINKMALKLNRWVSTEHYFDKVDKPRYIERAIYRNSTIVGLLIILGSAYCLFTFLYNTNIDYLITKLPLINDNELMTEWLYSSLIYILIAANFICLILGFIILLRPSCLKSIEKLSNQWIHTKPFLNKLDSTRSMPEYKLQGKMRVFGLFVIIGGIFIVMNTALFLSN